MNWTTVVLGECVSELRGGASIKRDEFTDYGFPVLHKGTIREGAHLVFDRDGKSHVPNAFAAAKPNAVVDSDFIVATFRNLVRTGETLGFMAPVPDEGQYLLAQGAYGLKLDDSRLDKRFLAHLSNAWVFHKEVLRRMVGTTQVHIRNSEFLKIPIPLPPLAEQKRIAVILDSADALRAMRRESIAQLDDLVRSTFLNMFGDPVTNPMGWERKTLGEVTSIDAPMVDPREEQNRGLLHYGPDRIEKDTGELLPAQTAEEDQLISSKFLCSPGEILYSKIRPYLNKVALVKERCLCSADVYPVVALPEHMTREYLWLLLRSQAFLDYVAGFSRRANIPKLNRKQFAGYAAPTPPLELQNRFVTIVESIDQQKALQRTHLDELDKLFASLQSRAFRGDL